MPPRSVIYIVVTVLFGMAFWQGTQGNVLGTVLWLFCAFVWADMLRKQRD